MPLLGIITCQILELEFAHLLAADRDIVNITVVSNGYADGLVEALKNEGVTAISLVDETESRQAPRPDGVSILVEVMQVGLHVSITLLRETVVAAVERTAPHVDGVLLGYGLCGNAMDPAADLFSSVDVPVFLPMDDGHPVDDCVGMIIGGREAYYEEQLKTAGTMFMNAGFTRHWKEIMLRGVGKTHGIEALQRMMEDYERTLALPTTVMSMEEMSPLIAEFNEMFGLRSEERVGTLEILGSALASAKESLLAEKELKRGAGCRSRDIS